MHRSRITSTLALTLAVSMSVAAAASSDLRAYEWNRDLIGADAANTVATGAGVIVAVIDSGVDIDHPEFAGRIVSPLSWADCPGVAPCTDLSAVDDGDGHGTHVSGTILAADDGVGTTGMAPDALLMPIRVFDDGGSAVGDVTAAIDYAVANGADVINLSLGYPGGSGVLLESIDGTNAAVKRAADAGVLVAFAAGNDSTPYCGGGQFIADTALCVGASGELEASYTNWGLQIDIVAPGGGFFTAGVPSTYPLDKQGNSTLGRGYTYMSGTSMASPHVAGVAALLAELGITGSAARTHLIDTASGFGGVDGLVSFSGPAGVGGRQLDAAAAVGAS
jgi:subtilisin family serine protease